MDYVIWLLYILGIIIGFVIFYYIIKAAVRDGHVEAVALIDKKRKDERDAEKKA